MSDALVLDGVRKRYGKRWALDGLSLSVPRGSITGLIGPNGAGKTTCFGTVSGLLTFDGGRIDVLGAGPFNPRTRGGELGLLPQDAELPPQTPVRKLLEFWAVPKDIHFRDVPSEFKRLGQIPAKSAQLEALIKQALDSIQAYRAEGEEKVKTYRDLAQGLTEVG